MTESMVERVARAINPNAQTHDERHIARVKAICAIEAMRTPDYHMLMAARDAFSRIATTRCSESEVLAMWLAAINQALES